MLDFEGVHGNIIHSVYTLSKAGIDTKDISVCLGKEIVWFLEQQLNTQRIKHNADDGTRTYAGFPVITTQQPYFIGACIGKSEEAKKI